MTKRERDSYHRKAKKVFNEEYAVSTIASFSPHTKEEIQTFIDTEIGQAAGLLTYEAACHLVADNLGIGKRFAIAMDRYVPGGACSG